MNNFNLKMNIVLSCLQSPFRYPIPAYDFWLTYFKNGIEEYGANVIELLEIDWVKPLATSNPSEQAKWRLENWSKIVSSIRKLHQEQGIDLFLSYFYPTQIEEGAIQEIKNMGIPTVNFFCDNVREFQEIPQQFKVFDLNWVPEYKAIKMYRQAGIPFVHAPMPMWVDNKWRVPSARETEEIGFIGSKDIVRSRFLAQAVENKLPITIRGAGWNSTTFEEFSQEVSQVKAIGVTQKLKRQVDFIIDHGFMPFYRKITNRYLYPMPSNDIFNGYIGSKPSFEEYIHLTRNNKIILGCNRYPSFHYSLNNPDTYSRLRDIEAPMLGACYLTEWTEGIEEMYDLGEEIETYKNVEELKEKILHLKKDDNKRKKLRTKGQKRSLSEHSVPKSIQKILDTL